MAGVLLPDLCGYFEGMWRMRRRIYGENARFEGIAAITPQHQILHYMEEGVLETPDYKGAAFRAYRYMPCGNKLDIAHADGTLFVTLAFDNGVACGQHICGADVYEVRVELCGCNRWRQYCRVRGPRKNMAIFTRYERL